MQERRAARGVRDRRRGPIEVIPDLSRCEPQEVAVAAAVKGDVMTLGDDLGRERGLPLDLLADQEEGGGCACRREDLEHRRGPCRVWTVVEGERDTLQPLETCRQ